MKKIAEKPHLCSNLSFSSTYKYNTVLSHSDSANIALSIDKKSHRSPLVYSDLDLKQNSYEPKSVVCVNKNLDEASVNDNTKKATNSANTQPQAKWHSFERKHQTEVSSTGSVSISSMTAAEMTHLKSVAILRLSTFLNRENESSANNNRRIPKMFRRLFSTETKSKSTKIKLSSNLIKYGQPLPPLIISVINYLKNTGVSCSGIFRKSGKKSNINILEEKFTNNVTEIDFSKYSCYDIADSLKSFIRKMPDALIPPKIASILISLQSLKEDKQLFVSQVAMLLIPDENRDALYMLLDCLHVISGNSNVNLMTPENLAICLAPSIFHLSPMECDKDRSYTFDVFNFSRFSCYTSSATAESCPSNTSFSYEFVTKGSIYTLAQQSIAYLINNFNELFSIPYDVHILSRITALQSGVPMKLEDFGKSDTKLKESYDSYMNVNIEEFYDEHKNKYKAWASCGINNGVHIYCRKVKDGYPLKLYRGTIDLNVLCTEAFNCYLYKGSLWSGNTQRFVIKSLSKNSDLFYQRYKHSYDYFNRDFTLLRKWRKINDTYILASNSIEICANDLKDCDLQAHQHNKILGRRLSPRGTILGSRFVVEPHQGKTRINLILRVDLKGKRASSYKYLTPYIISQELCSLRDYFAPSAHVSEVIV